MAIKSETKAQQYLRDKYGENAYIKKIPDFKQTGMLLGGIPDYMVIHNSITRWFEVKFIPTRRKSLSINDFTEQQLIEFTKMLKAGAEIHLIIFFNKIMINTEWKYVYDYFQTKNKSISKDVFTRGDIYGNGDIRL